MNNFIVSLLLIDSKIKPNHTVDLTYVGLQDDVCDSFVVLKAFVSRTNVDERNCYLSFRSKRARIGLSKPTLSSIEIHNSNNESLVKFHLENNDIDNLCNRVVTYLNDYIF